jgi:predicted DNA-binding protein (MmcQ/YjbR family)
MNIENLAAYCLNKKGVKEDFPFDEVTLTMKVMGKIFAFLPLDAQPPQISLKCDPDRAIELREEYEDIQSAFHLNKKHWNAILLEGNVPSKLIYELVDHSYDLVVKGLKKSERMQLLNEDN